MVSLPCRVAQRTPCETAVPQGIAWNEAEQAKFQIYQARVNCVIFSTGVIVQSMRRE